MTRDEIVEVMARALAEHDGRDPDAAATWFGGNKTWVEYESDAKAALSALEAAGMRVVPMREPVMCLACGLHVGCDCTRMRTGTSNWMTVEAAMLAASQEDGETRDA